MSDTLAADAYSRRDLWLCLARAFGKPAGDAFRDVFAQHLADDLKAIAEETGLVAHEDIAALRRDAARLGNDLDLLRLYSKLFIAPPTPVVLNAGFYMDGGKSGQIEQELRAIYARHGVAKNADMRDFYDAVPLQLEFLSFLYGRAGDYAKAAQNMEARAYMAEAEAFIARYPVQWCTPFLRDLEKACADDGLNRAYEHLARILWLAVEQARAGAPIEALPAGAGLPQGSSRGLGDVTAQDLAEVAYRLEQAGLAWDHVAANEAWSDAVFTARRALGDTDAVRA
ncbi:molecular chaperone [Roseinatronobacter sp. S2]|uniref:TorD/DmsD family molecular chaperone n=1 Tax=Roseinatronobacter sp. S2 TaxID=3035471 RepID=UPI00240F5B0C|nr:molecular chaperone TorD family protein [Roseinatronobacter sp. S2]WFE75323.1 molecular chaperone TorD family protein [Roseinatronobacter sp. S2]